MAGRSRLIRFFFSFPYVTSSLIWERTPRSTPLRFLTLLLAQCSTFKHISQAHSFMLSRGLDQDNLLLSKFIHVCSALGFKDYARMLFEGKRSPDVYLYNTMIRSLAQSDSARDAILLFNRIQAMGFRPDTYSFPFVLKAVARLSVFEVGTGIHGLVFRLGLISDIPISTALVHMYSSCRLINDARHLFDEMHHRDVVLWNAMIAGYVKFGDVDNARALFDEMPERNVISWTSVIAGYTQMNRADEAIAVFRRMQLEDSIEPDEIALLSALSACAQLGAQDLGKWIHGFIDKRRLRRTIPLMNALIDMYAKSGNIWKAFEVFESMKNRSIITWTTMISGFALHGLGDEASDLFGRMEREKIQPNDITFVAILSACSHIGDVELGRRFFNCMKSNYHVEPQIEHYGCMIDILGRAGCLKEARDLVKDMPFNPNAAIWGSLLSAARIQADIELGEEALEHLMEIEPQNSGNYSILSNIYAANNKWVDAGKLRKVMKDRGVEKAPGGSSIELNGRVHEFTSRDGGHPSFEKIYEVLNEANEHMKVIGYLMH
ncbi:Pentatricopeptide repeat-containing protein [Apostasia shenzhenica]|uniref:Pentatricopeptide repeat-containing protein n=1 Tax=Apostasia shenzhenica TaxID=1088818 RepID=A0A2I0B225_9ASPA|nr:Pentatricopeptide repeat-containing protein [Apostasia shenzhenica]